MSRLTRTSYVKHVKPGSKLQHIIPSRRCCPLPSRSSYFGVVERKNKTLITLARAMLDDYGTSEKFWAEAINTACHASNRVYPHRLLKKTPYELITGKKPN